MTRSEIFTLAHSIAKNTKANFSSYRLAFATALTIAYSQSKQIVIMKSELEIKLETLGVENANQVSQELEKIKDAKFEIWANYGKVRAYIHFSGTNKGKKTYIDLLSGQVNYEHAWSLVASALESTIYSIK